VLRPPSRPPKPELPPDGPPVLVPDEASSPAELEPTGQVPPTHVAPNALQSVQGPPLIPQALSSIPGTQVPLTSQHPLHAEPQAPPLPLLPPLLAPPPADDPLDATDPLSPWLSASVGPPSSPNKNPLRPVPPPHAQAATAAVNASRAGAVGSVAIRIWYLRRYWTHATCMAGMGAARGLKSGGRAIRTEVNSFDQEEPARVEPLPVRRRMTRSPQSMKIGPGAEARRRCRDDEAHHPRYRSLEPTVGSGTPTVTRIEKNVRPDPVRGICDAWMALAASPESCIERTAGDSVLRFQTLTTRPDVCAVPMEGTGRRKPWARQPPLLPRAPPPAPAPRPRPPRPPGPWQ
jgi:hypothetical protein